MGQLPPFGQEPPVSIIQIIQIVVAVHIGGRDLAEAHPALNFHFLHLIVDQLLDHQRILDILQHQRGHGLVGGHHRYRADTKYSLPKAAAGIDIQDAVQKHLVILDVQKAHGHEQPVFGQLIAGKRKRQAQMALAVLPQALDVDGYGNTLPGFFSMCKSALHSMIVL